MANWQHVFPKKKITCAHGVVDKLHPNGHRGTDYGLPIGVKIFAITDGKVVLSEKSHNLGNVTVIKLHTGKFWYSVHMQHPGLPVGTEVKCGDEIGKVGNTGAYCFGAHLHTGISDEKTGVYSGKVYDIVEYVDKQLAKAAKPAAPKVEEAPAAEVAPVAVVTDAAPSVSAPAEEPAKAKKPALKGELKLGSTGPAVTYLQESFGFKPTGKFGQKTHEAVIALQKKGGLKADGIVGPLTWKLVK